MAGRARSEPRASMGGNPFWSQRLQDELQLQAMRPLDLSTRSPLETLPPVPDCDWSDGEGSRLDPVQDGSKETLVDKVVGDQEVQWWEIEGALFKPPTAGGRLTECRVKVVRASCPNMTEADQWV